MISMPTRRRRKTVDTNEYLGMLARLIVNGGSRVAEADPEQLRQLLELRGVLDEAILEAVRGLREAEVTWEDIGAAAGTTRQAAIMRWNPKL
jgi:hypothetical protein